MINVHARSWAPLKKNPAILPLSLQYGRNLRELHKVKSEGKGQVLNDITHIFHAKI